MQKKLFTEEMLTKNIDREVLELVDVEDTEEILEEIRNSQEMCLFLESIKNPSPTEVLRKSTLLEELRLKERKGTK